MILIPSLVTLLNLVSGVLAMALFASGHSLQLSCLIIFTALIFDGLDGYVARRLNLKTSFGAIFDSIADFVTFGVAPAFLFYYSFIPPMIHAGFFVLLLFVLATGLRLTLFSYLQLKYKNYSFFLGLPSPTSGSLLLSFLFIGISPETHFEFYIAVLFCLSFLMLCSIPFPKPKSFPWNRITTTVNGIAAVFVLTFKPEAFPLAVIGVYFLWAITSGIRKMRAEGISFPIILQKEFWEDDKSKL